MLTRAHLKVARCQRDVPFAGQFKVASQRRGSQCKYANVHLAQCVHIAYSPMNHESCPAIPLGNRGHPVTQHGDQQIAACIDHQHASLAGLFDALPNQACGTAAAHRGYLAMKRHAAAIALPSHGRDPRFCTQRVGYI